ncbi:MAG: hypothetical protein V4736_16250 [Bdellovibrionota bacterium]
MKSLNRILLSLITLAGISATASPIPATGSSLLTDPQKGLQLFKHRIRVDLADSKWTLKETEAESNVVALDFIPRNPQDLTPTAQLSLRLDQLKKVSLFDEYIKRSMKEYPQFGFDVLGSQKVNLMGQPAFVVDLSQKKKGQQLRQVIFMQEKRVAVFTCLDETSHFKSTLAECNKLIQSFRWQN